MHHGNKGNKFGTCLGPRETGARHSFYNSQCVFSVQPELNFPDCFNVKVCDLCCQGSGRSIYSQRCTHERSKQEFRIRQQETAAKFAEDVSSIIGSDHWQQQEELAQLERTRQRLLPGCSGQELFWRWPRQWSNKVIEAIWYNKIAILEIYFVITDSNVNNSFNNIKNSQLQYKTNFDNTNNKTKPNINSNMNNNIKKTILNIDNAKQYLTIGGLWWP